VPLTARGARTRARIVEAAADLILNCGVSETSLDAILAASQTSKSQLYHYFADKDDLVLAVITRQTERVLQGQQPQLDELDSLAGFQRWCERLTENQRRYGCDTGCPIGSLAAELPGMPAARALLVASFARWESYLAAGLTTMQHRGDLDPDTDPDDLATTVMTAVQGGLLLSKTTRSTRPLELALGMALSHIQSSTGRRASEP
jgi:TetR/AcrR family transcriptional repressor of nem operon